MLKRLLGKRTFTLLIVPDSGAGIRSVRFTLSRLRATAVGGFLVTILLVGAVVLPGLRSLLDPLGTARQNSLLRQRVEGLDQDLDRLRRRVEESSALETRLRVVAGLGPIDSEVRQMGVGGPDFAAEDALARIDPQVAEEVGQVARSAEELLREAELQRYSFLEIVESLEKDREAWARVPSIVPVSDGEVTSGYGGRVDPFTEKHAFHYGLDMSAQRGTSILATGGGRVVFAGRDGAYGLAVAIDHGNGIETRYAHVLDVKVARGQQVKRGQEIALVGNTGRSTAPHVHYEVRVNGRAVNPGAYILPGDEVVD